MGIQPLPGWILVYILCTSVCVSTVENMTDVQTIVPVDVSTTTLSPFLSNVTVLPAILSQVTQNVLNVTTADVTDSNVFDVSLESDVSNVSNISDVSDVPNVSDTSDEETDMSNMSEESTDVLNVTETTLLPMLEDETNITDAEILLAAETVTNSSILEGLVNSTRHRGIIHGFSESISVILVSEIGDKTFFIAAILAMRNNKLIVLLAALSALFLMTILSALLGWVVTTFIPREITYYTCTAIMFAFSLKMFWEAWRMDEDEMEETQREVEQELAEMDRSNLRAGIQGDTERGQGDGDSVETTGEVNPGFDITTDLNVGNTYQPEPQPEPHPQPHLQSQSQSNSYPTENTLQGEVRQGLEDKKNNIKTIEPSWMDTAIDRSCKENSWFGKKCLKIFKLFVNTFTLTFIAEWGDRSQLATIVLAGINDVIGVILGGCLGHAVCTSAAVLAGAIIARFVSIRKITLLGALVFLGFAIASIFIDPNEDGIDGIPEIQGYDNTTRLINHNISLTIQMEEAEGRSYI